MRKKHTKRRKRADCLEDLVKPKDPAMGGQGTVIDDGALMALVDELALAEDVDKLLHLAHELADVDPDRAEMVLQTIKLKYPNMYNRLQKAEGIFDDWSLTSKIVDGETRREAMRYRSRRRPLRDSTSRPRLGGGLRSYRRERDMKEDAYTEEGLEEEEPRPLRRRRRRPGRRSRLSDLARPVRRRPRRAMEGDPLGEDRLKGKGTEKKTKTERPAGPEDPLSYKSFEEYMKKMKKGRSLKTAQDEDDSEPEVLDLEDLELDLDLEGLELDEEVLEELEGEEAICPPGCVPAEEAEEEAEEEEEGEEEEKEEEEAEEEGAEEEEEEEKKEAAATGPVLVQRIFTDEDLDALKDAKFDFILFQGESPKYAVFAGGHPLCEIHQADQNLKGEAADLFFLDSYKERIKEGIAHFGVAETFKTVKARFYATAAYEGDVAEKMKKAVRTEYDGERKEALAELKEKFLNTMALVVEGSIKNYWSENPLKEATVRSFGSLNIPPNVCIDKLEAAWRQAGAEYFEMLVNRADELMGAPADVVKHHAAEIASMEWRHPGYEPEDHTIPTVTARSQVEPAVPKSVPIVTHGGPAAVPREAATEGESKKWNAKEWKEKMRLGQKLAVANLDPKLLKRQ